MPDSIAGRGRLAFAAIAVAVMILAAACGDDSGSDESADSSADIETGDGGAPVTEDGSVGPGPWTSAQLCTLATDDQVTVVMVGLDATEDLPATEVGEMQCSWTDFDAGRDALRIEQSEIESGDDLSARGDPIDIDGADVAVFNESGVVGDNAENTLWVVVGDQELELNYPKDAAEGRTLVESIATTWVAVQAG